VFLADFAILVSMASIETRVLCHDDFLCSMEEHCAFFHGQASKERATQAPSRCFNLARKVGGSQVVNLGRFRR